MATTINAAKAGHQISWTVSKDKSTGTYVKDENSTSYRKLYTSGTGANQCNVEWDYKFTLGNSADTTFVLGNNSITNDQGVTLALTKIKEIRIDHMDATNSTGITIGNAASNQVTAFRGASGVIAVVPNGGQWSMSAPGSAGFAVSAGSTDQLKVANNDAGNTATVRITLLGVQ